MQFENHRRHTAHDEFSRLAMEFDRLAVCSLSDESVERYDYKARQLLKIARMTRDESHNSFACAAFGRIHRERIRRELAEVL